MRNPVPGTFEEALDDADCAPSLYNHQLGCTFYKTKRDWVAVQQLLNRWHNEDTPDDYYYIKG